MTVRDYLYCRACRHLGPRGRFDARHEPTTSRLCFVCPACQSFDVEDVVDVVVGDGRVVASEDLVALYDKVKELWSAVLFDWDSAPDGMRREAHAVVLTGLDEVVRLVGAMARGALRAEWERAEQAVRNEKS